MIYSNRTFNVPRRNIINRLNLDAHHSNMSQRNTVTHYRSASPMICETLYTAASLCNVVTRDLLASQTLFDALYIHAESMI
jgi:hypothetical protein